MHGRSVELAGVSQVFDGFTAVHPTDLTIRSGEFFSVLGPSGCGKTTLLRIISGFLTPTTGSVSIGDAPVTHLPANRRPTAMIFQNLALFPLMKVWENVAFGLEARGVGRRERRRRAAELLDLVELAGQGDKTPAQLSGGQRQRVAIARALAVEPAVLCLDEPLSALDLKLRLRMRHELRDLQKRTGVTFVYITHDQGEALAMSDRIAVMNAGRIEQVDTGDAVYAEPATPFVATFVGAQNAFHGRVAGVEAGMARVETPVGALLGRNPHRLATGEAAVLFVRPERIGLVDRGAGRSDNVFEAETVRRDLEGPFANLTMRSGSAEIVLHLPNDGRPAPQGRCDIGFAAGDAVVMRPAEPARQPEAAA